MPNVTLQIEEPKINPSGSNYFKVRYRLKGATTWVDDPINRNNDPYVYDFDSSGTWEMGITLYLDDDNPCPENIYEIEVKDSCNCVTGTALEVLPNAGATDIYKRQIKIYYTLPDPEPPCGWIIYIINTDGTRKTLVFPTLVGTESVHLLIEKGDDTIEMHANCCNEFNSPI